jgi:hypothetical protein
MTSTAAKRIHKPTVYKKKRKPRNPPLRLPHPYGTFVTTCLKGKGNKLRLVYPFYEEKEIISVSDDNEEEKWTEEWWGECTSINTSTSTWDTLLESPLCDVSLGNSTMLAVKDLYKKCQEHPELLQPPIQDAKILRLGLPLTEKNICKMGYLFNFVGNLSTDPPPFSLLKAAIERHFTYYNIFPGDGNRKMDFLKKRYLATACVLYVVIKNV